MYYVYMLRCADGSLYTGSTTDVQRRFLQHQAGNGAKYTKSHPPLTVAASWEVSDRSAALRLETRIKRLSRAEKERMLKRSTGADAPVFEE